MDFLNEVIHTPSAVASLIGSVITAGISIQVMFLKWLIDRFDKLTLALKEQGNMMHEWLMEHEQKDLDRHEANLQKFEKINVSLARLGAEH